MSIVTQKIVALNSGGFCAFQGCTVRLVADATQASPDTIRGEIAHIAGEKAGSARYDPSMTDDQRNAAANLIFLCPNHHTDIDKQHQSYSVESLRKMKADHELGVRQTLRRELAELTFVELKELCDAFADLARVTPLDSSLDWTAVQAKVSKNELQDVEEDVQLGLSRVTVVRDYIAERNKIDSSFEDRLRYGFKSLYAEFRADRKRASEIYLDLVAYARRHSPNGSSAAALATVYTLFEACDIFEL